MQIFPLASSSDGNVTLIQSGNTRILIDCGISLRTLTEKLGYKTIAAIDAVFVTHEHADHIRGIGPFGRKFKETPIYMHQESYNHRKKYLKKIKHYPLDSVDVNIGDLTIRSFPAYHDTKNTFGFHIETRDGNRLSYITDTGYIMDEAYNYLLESNILFIESNYDEFGLIDYPGYPDYMKDRIRETHLSNLQTLEIIDDIGIGKYRKIILGHLSPRSNRPEWVENGFSRRFSDYTDILTIAPTIKAVEIQS